MTRAARIQVEPDEENKHGMMVGAKELVERLLSLAIATFSSAAGRRVRCHDEVTVAVRVHVARANSLE